MSSMTDKQEAFAREYLVDCNATQAAMRAGYSARTASQTGHELLGKPAVTERITELKAEREQRTEITADQTLADLRYVADQAIGRAPVRKVAMVNGEFVEGEVHETNIPGAARALELLARHQGDMGDQISVQHSGDISAFLATLAEAPESTPAGRIKAREAARVGDSGDQ